jgi:hypothetical protein
MLESMLCCCCCRCLAWNLDVQLRECGGLDCIVELLGSTGEPHMQRAALVALRTFIQSNYQPNKDYMAECGALDAVMMVGLLYDREQ